MIASARLSSSFQASPRKTVVRRRPASIRSSFSMLNNFTIIGVPKFATAHADSIGKRLTMEDYCVSYRDFAGHNTQYYALFDGHGGSQVSSHLASTLHKMIANNYRHEGCSFLSAISKALKEINQEMIESYISGSTAAIAIIDQGEILYTANVGDSRIVLVNKSGRAKRLSIDHRTSNQTEVINVIKRGGTIKKGRVNGTLMLTRSVGDANVQPYISVEPYMTQTIISQSSMNTGKLIIACDGVWDVMDDQTAADIFSNMQQVDEAARAIRDEALKRGSADNVSVICVDLRAKY